MHRAEAQAGKAYRLWRRRMQWRRVRGTRTPCAYLCQSCRVSGNDQLPSPALRGGAEPAHVPRFKRQGSSMNSSPVSFRSAVADDATDMVAVHYASVHAIPPGQYPVAILSAWSPTPDEQRREWLANLLAQDTTVCEVAISGNDAIVGFCLALPYQSRLQALYVHPEYAGRGIGASLLRAVEAHCRAVGADMLELNASFNAENFYRANGYVAIRKTMQPLTDGSAMGAVSMSKRLASGGHADG